MATTVYAYAHVHMVYATQTMHTPISSNGNIEYALGVGLWDRGWEKKTRATVGIRVSIDDKCRLDDISHLRKSINMSQSLSLTHASQ